MEKNQIVYIIDSSSLIDFMKYYPMERATTIWGFLEDLVSKNRLKAPQEVFDEIIPDDDDIAKWLMTHEKAIKSPDSQFREDKALEIIGRFPGLVKPDATRTDADAYVIADAIDRKIRQTSLLSFSPSTDPVCFCVVSEEQLKGDKIRIPKVCKEYNINCMSMTGFWVTENWKV